MKANISCGFRGFLLLPLVLCGLTPANAATLQLDFSNSGAFSGNAPSVSDPNAVYASAIFADAGLNTVTLTMSVLNGILPSGAYVNDWYFNLDPALAALSIGFSSGTAASTVDPFSINAYKADGTGGDFDFAFHFSTANPGQLAQGGTSVYTLTGTGITASSFNFLSVGHPNSGPYLGAIHVQGYGDSVWVGTEEPACTVDCGDVPVPEPSMLALMGMGMLGMAVSYSRRRKFN